jgi:prevent-host-death family protein
MNMSSDIKPITYLKANAADLLEQINETHRPVIITQNGEPRAVLQDPQSYENMRNALGMLKLISQGEEDMKKGKTKSQENVFDKLEKRFVRYHRIYCQRQSLAGQKNPAHNKTCRLQPVSLTQSGTHHSRASRARGVAVSRTDHFALEGYV